jgi:hypothetical protein
MFNTKLPARFNYWKIGTIALVSLLVVAFGVWFYLTPYLAVWNMRTAAVNRDAQTFCSYIDFPVFKENLKSELNAKMLVNMQQDQTLKDNPFSGLALTVVPTIVNNMVDAYISPAGIERLFKEGARQAEQTQNVPAQTFNEEFLSESKNEINTGYNSFSEFEVSIKPKTGEGSKLIFERRGLFGWQLVNMKFD